MVMAISASASMSGASSPLHTEHTPLKPDTQPGGLPAAVQVPGVVVDFSDEGKALSASVVSTKAQEVLAILDVNLDGELSLDGFVAAAPTG